jgi:hypothetical protein
MSETTNTDERSSVATNLDDARARKNAEVHRTVSLDLIRATPAYAVRTPRGQKDPGHIKWDPKLANDEISAQNIHALSRNEDNVGIHLFGPMVDVDVDSDNLFLSVALDHFLPYTAHVWGRASRPRTHRLYQVSVLGDMFDPSLYRFLAYAAKVDEIKMELRGGRKENARYSLMPGSLHPSGEYYEWEDLDSARSTPVIVPDHSLVKGVRLAMVAALIAPYWTEGVRNTLCMALSGFLYKAVTFSQELGSDDPWSVLQKQDAEELIKGIARISGDDEADLPSRLRTLDQTWEKAQEGAPTRGATAITEITGNPGMLRHLYALLTDSQGLVEFEEFAKNYAFWMNEAKVVDLPALKQTGTTPFMTPDQFHTSYGHLSIQGPSGNAIKLTRMYMNSAHIQRFKKMGFNPKKPDLYEDPKHEGLLCLNSWSGYAIDPHIDSVTDDDVRPFLDYVDQIIASNDDHTARWVKAWCADIFQNPDSKTGTALVLVGKPGAGKSTLGSLFLRRIIGGRHATATNAVDDVIAKFNYDYCFKLLIQLDEAMNSNQRKDAALLKALITDEDRKMELKNVNSTTVPDVCRYLFTSNLLDDAVAMTDGLDDRRYTIIEVNPMFCKASTLVTDAEKHEYWSGLTEWANDEENLAKLHKWFLQFPLDRALVRRPLENEARNTMAQSTARGIEGYLMVLAGLDHPFEQHQKPEEWWSETKEGIETLEEWPEWAYYEEIAAGYKRYCRSIRGHVQDRNAQQLIQFMKTEHLIPKSAERKRKRVTVSTRFDEDSGAIKKEQAFRTLNMFPTKAKLLDWLRKKYGYEPGHGETIEVQLEPEQPKSEVKF